MGQGEGHWQRSGGSPGQGCAVQQVVTPPLLSRQKLGFFNQQYTDQLNMQEMATVYLQCNFNLPYQQLLLSATGSAAIIAKR